MLETTVIQLRVKTRILWVFFFSFLFLKLQTEKLPSTARYYTHYSSTVWFLYVWKWLYQPSYTQTSCIFFAVKVPQNVTIASASPSARSTTQAGMSLCRGVTARSKPDVLDAQWEFVHSFFFIGSHKGAGTVLEGRTLWPLRHRSSPGILPSTAVTCGCYLRSGYYLCFTALNPRQRHPTPSTQQQPPLILTSSQPNVLSLLWIDGSIQATSAYRSIVEHGLAVI